MKDSNPVTAHFLISLKLYNRNISFRFKDLTTMKGNSTYRKSHYSAQTLAQYHSIKTLEQCSTMTQREESRIMLRVCKNRSNVTQKFTKTKYD